MCFINKLMSLLTHTLTPSGVTGETIGRHGTKALDHTYRRECCLEGSTCKGLGKLIRGTD